MNNLEKIFVEKQNAVDYCKGYTSYLKELLDRLDFEAIDRIIEVFLKARGKGKKIFFLGNGGSAATSSHFTEDLSTITFHLDQPAFKAISLTDNIAYITALGNDEGYEYIFVGQLKTLLEPGDIVVGISGSGNSPNVIRALEYANENDGITIGLVGFDGGKMKSICDYVVHIKTLKGEYGPVEDLHLILVHIICTYLRLKLKKTSN